MTGAWDDPYCGLETQPCKSIKYAIETRTIDGDAILIDGGCGEYIYNISETIIIDKQLTITGLLNRQECEYPLLMTTSSAQFPGGFAMFDVRSNLNTSLLRYTMTLPSTWYHYASIFSVNGSESAIQLQVSDSSLTNVWGIITFVTENNNVNFENCNFSIL